MAKGFGGIPGGGNMQNLLKDAQKMQQQLRKVQEDAENSSTEFQAGGGMVKVTMTGKYKITSLEIAPEAINPDDKGLLEDMIQAAVNGAVDKIQEQLQAEMSKITGGMNIPGLF